MKSGLARGLSNSPGGLAGVSCAKQEKDGERRRWNGNRKERGRGRYPGQVGNGEKETKLEKGEISSEPATLKFPISFGAQYSYETGVCRVSRVLVRQLMSYSRCKKENDRAREERERERSGRTDRDFLSVRVSYRLPASYTLYLETAPFFLLSLLSLSLSPSLPLLLHRFRRFPARFFRRFSPLLARNESSLEARHGKC